MSTSQATVDHLLDTLSALPLTAKRMFGEYGLYLDGAVVALVCDDRLFLKPLPGAVAALPDAPMGLPFSRAKPHIDATEALDDPDRVIAALRAVARERPAPKPKRPRT